MPKLILIASLLLSMFAFLSVLIQQREIAGLEKRIVDQADLLQQIHERDRDIFSQGRRIRDLSATIEVMKAQNAEESIKNTIRLQDALMGDFPKNKPAPIGITPGQGTVRPPDKRQP